MTDSIGRILVVDDNPMNLDLLSRRLERKGFQVEAASGGQEAIDRCENEDFDLMLLDIMMPDVTGMQVLETVRKQYSTAELPIIMTTARTQSEDIVAALNAGANDYVTKPIDFNVLMARIHTHLNLRNLFQLKTEFLSMASHDLKNPLFVIVCQAYLIATKAPVGATMTPEVMDMVNNIAQHSRQMQQIITDFLDFQAVEDGHIRLDKKPVNLADLASTVVRNLQPYAQEKEIELAVSVPSGVPCTVIADHNRIDQVVQNLAGNALKFNPPGGRVVIEVQAVDGGGELRVVDNGPGLTPQDLEKIFVQTGKLSNKPTGGEASNGLGLSICRKLIELHDGEIGARNNDDGGGATFWFRLPAAALDS